MHSINNYYYYFSSQCLCYLEEQNLTPCWICFFYFNLCFPLLLFTKKILSIHNGLPQGTLPLCLKVKPKCLGIADPFLTCEWKEEINTSLPQGRPFQEIFKRLWAFLLYFLTSSTFPFYLRNWHLDP